MESFLTPQLVLYNPDGNRFLSYLELADALDSTSTILEATCLILDSTQETLETTCEKLNEAHQTITTIADKLSSAEEQNNLLREKLRA
jgi:hypothetical protein